MSAPTRPAAAGGEAGEGKKRRRAPKKAKDAKKKAPGKDGKVDAPAPEDDFVWEAVEVAEASESDEEEDKGHADEARAVVNLFASDHGGVPKPSGPMIRSGKVVQADSDPEEDSDFDAPQDGGIKRLVQSVRNRKRQTSRGHQLPPEERAREKQLEAKRREKEERKRKRKEEKERAAKGQTTTGEGAVQTKKVAGVTVDLGDEDEEEDKKEGADVKAEASGGGGDAVLEIDLEDKRALRESQGSDGPKKKTLRMTKVEKDVYRHAHHAQLLAYVAHLRQLNAAANDAEVHATVLSLLPAAEWPRRDAQGVAYADAIAMLGLARWVRTTFAQAEPKTEPRPAAGAAAEEPKVTPKKKRKSEAGENKEKKAKSAKGDKKAKKGKGKGQGDFDDESDFEVKREAASESEGEAAADSDDEPVVKKAAAKAKRSPKASASPLKTQQEAVNVKALPRWHPQYWKQRLMAVLSREHTATRKDQQTLYVALMRALGLDARVVCSVAYLPLAKTKDFSLTPDKDEEAAGKPYPAHGNDLALDMCWAEVYSPQMHRWVHVDVATCLVNKPQQPEATLNDGSRRVFTSLVYVLGVDRRDAVRDITRRYAKSFASVACAVRTDFEWWSRTLQRLNPVPDADTAARDRDEDEELVAKEAETGEFPTSKETYRKHPLYVLEKFVGKFDIIYPKEKPLGFCGQEAIWPRSAVHHLHTLDGWLKEGREVRVGEAPIKRVPKRKRKNNKEGTGEELKDLDTELFGLWQTEPYQRPVAVDGIVPKNGHGNVYLYQKWMLPVGCVQVNLPQIARTCRYLKVDYAQALVGWEPRGGWNCPVFEGVVICEEFYDSVREAWEEQYSRRQAKELLEQRRKAVTLWRKFAKALLIRDRLKRTYAADEGKAGAAPEGGEEEVKQLPTLANASRHVHSFGAGVQGADGNWRKSCGCGYSVQYEEI